MALFAVFPHAERRKPTGRGWVVRPVAWDGIQNGSFQALDSFNYGGMTPTTTHDTERAAQRHANKLNASGLLLAISA